MRTMKLGKSGRLGIDQYGFTLVEVIITMAILSILSAIAITAYDKQKRKGYRSEAVIALTTLAQLEERYMTENGSYANTLTALNVPTKILNASAETPKQHYVLTVTIPNGPECTAAVNNGANRYYCYQLTATAINTQVADSTCATLILDQTGKRNSTGGGTDCWSK